MIRSDHRTRSSIGGPKIQVARCEVDEREWEMKEATEWAKPFTIRPFTCPRIGIGRPGEVFDELILWGASLPFIMLPLAPPAIWLILFDLICLDLWFLLGVPLWFCKENCDAAEERENERNVTVSERVFLINALAAGVYIALVLPNSPSSC